MTTTIKNNESATPYTISTDGILTNVARNTVIANIPKEVKKIDRNAFQNCKNTLKHIIINGHIKVILAGTFACFKKLHSVDFLNGVDHLEDFSFYDCHKLHSVVIKKKLKSIGESCFEGCTELPFIHILDTIEYIGNDAYKGCKNLEVKIAKNNSEIKIPNTNKINTINYYLEPNALIGCKLIVEKYLSLEQQILEEQKNLQYSITANKQSPR